MEEKKKIWMSHSGLDVMDRCPRCFWLMYKKGLYQPEGITSRLPDRFDKIIKSYFDKFRRENKLPPLIDGRIEAKLENPFQEKYFYKINEKYGFWGKLDECFIDKNNLHIPVDFKTSSSDPREKSIFQSYQNQLDEYAFLLEQNNKKTAGLGLLIFFYPDNSDSLENGFPMIVHLQNVKTNSQRAKERLFKAINLLEGDIPQPADNCPYCGWYDKISKILNGN